MSKKVWIGLGAVAVIGLIGSALNDDSEAVADKAAASTSQAAVTPDSTARDKYFADTPTPEPTTEAPVVTTEAPAPAPEPAPVTTEAPAPAPAPEADSGRTRAADKAQSYLDFQAFSRKGLIDQLVYEGFSTDEATYGVDYISVDWNQQAVAKAKSYLSFQSFSKSGLIDQLVYEGFTPAQAQYGADKAY